MELVPASMERVMGVGNRSTRLAYCGSKGNAIRYVGIAVGHVLWTDAFRGRRSALNE